MLMFRQTEVLHSHPVSSVPKNTLKAPPLDTSNPTPAHSWLPVPSSSAKLKSTGGAAISAIRSSSSDNASAPPTSSHTVPGPQFLNRFPPQSRSLSEHDLDPYFLNFEASTRDLELLLH